VTYFKCLTLSLEPVFSKSVTGDGTAAQAAVIF
jgi:hypothetical protein